MVNAKGLAFLRMIVLAALAVSSAFADTPSDFANPPLAYKTRPLWFWQGNLNTAGISDIMQNSRDQSGYGGFGILPCSSGMNPGFMSADYFTRYGDALSKAAQLGMHMCLYDDLDFPSGWAGGQLATLYPEATAQRLDMVAVDVSGPTSYTREVPAGALMGVVAMDNGSKARTDITSSVSGGYLSWNVPAGSYKVMIFTCVRDGWNRVNYFDESAVRKYISLTYQKYYDHFPTYFGNVIDKAFYDEPTMWTVQGGRMWTAAFNEGFQITYGYNPILYYPALWFDIGVDTASARNLLLSYRADLFADGFVKTINDWCAAHSIKLTGHADQEEVVNPAGLSGDLMKFFKYQDIPGIDEISNYGRASKAYKIVSSAAFNYDKPLIMSECYGAMDNLTVNGLYQEAMDQYAKGINLMVPHAVWYNNANVWYPKELSYRDSVFGPALPAYNSYMGRLNLLLQGGRHVADIGVLYPIATLQAGYTMDTGDPYSGTGVVPAEADYMNVGEYLALGVRRDYTFIHPDVLDGKCSVDGASLNLDNSTNFEQYKVFIIPGSKAISLSNLKKVQLFYNNGGKVIATTQLPNKSVELGHDADVSAIIASMFSSTSSYPQITASSVFGAGYEPKQAADGDATTRWNAADQSGGNQWLQIDFGASTNFNQTTIKEAYNRVTSYNIQYWNGSAWVNCVSGTTIGAAKTDTFATVSASKVRLFINTIASDSASIYEFEVHNNGGANLSLNTSIATQTNASGGKSFFIASPNAINLKSALDDALAVYDVRFETDPAIAAGENLSYIHKVKDGSDLYFFANSSNTNIDIFVRLRGGFVPQLWDPYSGSISAPEYSIVNDNGQSVTRVRLVLSAIKSVFIKSTPSGPAGFTWCANEGGSYPLPGVCDVAYGANGSFNYLSGKTGTITFDNATFGDPISGIAKAGFYKVAQLTLTASAGGNGAISPSGSVKVNAGASQTFTITPSAGYTVNAVTVDGASVGAVSSYTFSNVTVAHTISASFTAIAGPAGYTWCAGESGSFALPGICDVAFGANGSFNYLPGKTGTITFDNATFGDPIPGVVKAGFYKLSITQYTLTASTGAGGAISPSGSVKVNQGASQTFAISPSAGYVINAVTVDGANAGAVTSYTFSNVQAAHTISATFSAVPVGPAGYTWCASENSSFTLPGTCDVAYGANGSFNYLTGKTGTITFNNTTFGDPIPGIVKAGYYKVSSTTTSYTLTASVGANGAISPSGSVVVNAGASQVFTITPSAGYVVNAVTVDGASVGAVTSYTFSNVAAAHSISATFKLAPVTQYTLTASAGAGGSISPSGAVTVNSGASQAFTITASAGYTIASVTVDGSNQGAITSYTFSNVAASHTIAATFAQSGVAAWAVGVHYLNGALVTYGGKTWKNTFDHTSQADWYPGASGIWFWVAQ